MLYKQQNKTQRPLYHNLETIQPTTIGVFSLLWQFPMLHGGLYP